MVEALLAQMPDRGIYHAGGPERYSRAEIGAIMADVYGFSGENLRAVEYSRPEELMPTDDVTLCTKKIRAATGITFTALRTGLQSSRLDGF